MNSNNFVFEAAASAELPLATTLPSVSPVEKCLNGSRVAFKTNGHSSDGLSVLDLRPSGVAQTSFVAQRNPAEARLRRASWSFMTHRVDQTAATRLLTGDVIPQAGDVVLARIDALGHHANLHLPNGRKRSEERRVGEGGRHTG